MTRSRVVGLIVRVVLVCATVVIITRLASKIDFAKVWTAISTLSLADVAVLVLLLALVRMLNATPMSLLGLLQVRLTSLTRDEVSREGCRYAEEVPRGVQAGRGQGRSPW